MKSISPEIKLESFPDYNTGLPERIVAVAVGLFRKRGYKGTTISDIAHTCRISRKTLYDLFSSKEDIINVVIWRELSLLMDELNCREPGIAPEIKLMELCRGIFAGFDASPREHFIWALLSADEVPANAAYSTLGAVINGLHEEGCGEGVFKQVEKPLAADFVLACIKAARGACIGSANDRYRLYNESLVMIASGIANPDITLEFRGFRKDYYKILEVTPDISQEEIKQVYRSFSKQYHPDSNRSAAADLERYHDIRKAYDILNDSVRRREYNEFLKMPLSTRSGSCDYDFNPA